VLVGAVKRRATDLTDDELAMIIAGGKLPPPQPALPAIIDATARDIGSDTTDRSDDTELAERTADVEREITAEIEISATLRDLRDANNAA
jgi:hypothetical protein